MDAPDAGRDELDGALRFIRAINRRLGGTKGLISCLSAWSRNWPKDRPVTLLDIGTGSADIPVAARVWALERGFDLRILGVDVHATTLDLAHEFVSKQPNDVREGIRLLQADAIRLTDTVRPGDYDYAHAGMFLHHLSDIEVLTMLAIMDRIVKRGICWNDLSRSTFARVGVRLLTLGANEMVRHDAKVSVEAGFTRREAMDLAHRAGLDYCSFKSMFFAQRFVVSGEKPGAWSVP